MLDLNVKYTEIKWLNIDLKGGGEFCVSSCVNAEHEVVTASVCSYNDIGNDEEKKGVGC